MRISFITSCFSSDQGKFLMHKMPHIFIMILLFFPVKSGFPKTIPFPDQKNPLFTMETPLNWTVEQYNSVLTVFPPDQSVFFNGFHLQVSNWEHAMLAIHDLLNEKIPKLENSEPEAIDIHDYTFFFYYGSGINDKGKLNKVTLSFFSPDENNFCVFLYFGTPAAIKRYTVDIQKMFLSIR